MIRAAFADLVVADVPRSVAFHCSLLGLAVVIDHGWYVELGADDRVLLALVAQGHETVPEAAGRGPQGVLVSFEVDDAAAYEARAVAMGCSFVVPFTRELGQAHFMVLDPDGTVIDVFERVPLGAADLRRLVRLRRALLQRHAAMWHIGELAQRLRVTTRTIRHYEQLGLLLPQSVDQRSGYRTYGPQQLVRGLQIEQLKAAGLALGEIRDALDDPSAWDRSADASHRRIATRLAEARRQLTTLDLLVAARERTATPEVLDIEAGHVISTCITASVGDLAPAIRRAMQQLGRLARRDGGRCATYSARLPLDLDDDVEVEVLGHLDGPITGSHRQPAERCLAVTWTGSIDLLPIVYDLVLETADDRRIATAGVVVEHYLDLAAIGTTVVRVPLA